MSKNMDSLDLTHGDFLKMARMSLNHVISKSDDPSEISKATDLMTNSLNSFEAAKEKYDGCEMDYDSWFAELRRFVGVEL